jgi:hypothetical protein
MPWCGTLPSDPAARSPRVQMRRGSPLRDAPFVPARVGQDGAVERAGRENRLLGRGVDRHDLVQAYDTFGAAAREKALKVIVRA